MWCIPITISYMLFTHVCREVVVKRRERVTQLVFEAARLKAALSAMMKGSGEVLSVLLRD